MLSMYFGLPAFHCQLLKVVTNILRSLFRSKSIVTIQVILVSNCLDVGTDLQRGLLALSELSSVPFEVGEAKFAAFRSNLMRQLNSYSPFITPALFCD